MNSAIARFALVAAALVQFKDFDGKLAYVRKQVPKLDADGEPVLDDDGQPVLVEVDDLDKPIGVRMPAPGSKMHRAADDAVAKLVRDRTKDMSKKERELFNGSPSTFHWMGNQRAARLVTEFVNFDYQGKGASVENTLAFLEDSDWTFLADQVRSGTGDTERFLANPSSN